MSATGRSAPSAAPQPKPRTDETTESIILGWEDDTDDITNPHSPRPKKPKIRNLPSQPLSFTEPTMSFSASTTSAYRTQDHVAELQRHVEVLKIEKREVELESDARVRGLEGQLRELRGVVQDLERQVHVLTDELEVKNLLLRNAEIPIAQSTEQASDRPQISISVLTENARLRAECSALKKALEKSAKPQSVSFTNEQSSGQIAEEVNRLLSKAPQRSARVPSPVRQHVRRVDQTCQTDTINLHKCSHQSQAALVDKLTAELNAEKSQSRKNAKELDDMKFLLKDSQQELKNLQQKYHILSVRAESALTAEQNLRNALSEHKDMLNKYEDQIVEGDSQVKHYKTELDRLSAEYKRYKAAQKLVNESNDKNIEHLKELLKKALERPTSSTENKDVLLSPSIAAELKMYRDGYEGEIALLQTQLRTLTLEKDEIEKRLQISQQEVERLRQEAMRARKLDQDALALNLKVEETLRKFAKVKLELVKERSFSHALQHQIEDLTTAQETNTRIRKKKEHLISNMRAEITRKNALIKESQTELHKLTTSFKELEQKHKALGSSQTSKDAMISNLKAKNDTLAHQIEAMSKEREHVADSKMKEVERKWKMELKRKGEMADSWKSRWEQVSKELETLRKHTQTFISPKQHTSTIESLHLATKRLQTAEERAQQWQHKHEQLQRALERIVENLVHQKTLGGGSLYELPPVGDTDSTMDPAVLEKAKEISKRILNVDYDNIMAPSTTMSQDSGIDILSVFDSNDLRMSYVQRMKELFLRPQFEEELVGLVSEVVAGS
ncbi:uncharacterized protein SPPG_06839 [Spizellomyces punctatus DAOM BR117]|uniref:Uncharacterized protein n=1 Tax=Spizellomyces punctatus (strain DAOM BR117) TaxID=645134 RepID=A0A0L0HAU6_SPIPD|nr:uncharacterized protein SPPG_06839 [Spizellomyces punctatus DAOM BR117]KNC97843.1 hypothetical protein SPPG_06839 [Spizellomyces punctatus DAOM BR117]|eukprot:XP_016605883.1 hypothetical protein SPPG_06839 [Spizellomyces punctatus DAOM BR117]